MVGTNGFYNVNVRSSSYKKKTNKKTPKAYKCYLRNNKTGIVQQMPEPAMSTCVGSYVEVNARLRSAASI